MRCVLIYNPEAGRGRKQRAEQLRQAADALNGLGHVVEVMTTNAPGCATMQAKEAVRQGAEIVFACGGDGTVHEVLQGLVSDSGEHTAALGIIPMGSANALARHLRLPRNPVKAVLRQIDVVPRTIPVGKAYFDGRVRYFTVMAGAGPDGALVYDLLTAHKSSLGRMAYYLRAARLFATRRFHPFEVHYDELRSGARVARRAVSVMAVRVGSLGGLFSRLAGRGGGIEDNQLRLMILGPPAWLSLPLWFLCGWLGMRGFNPFFRVVEVAGFSCFALSGPAAHFEADGEWLGHIPIEVSLIPNALRILIPE